MGQQGRKKIKEGNWRGDKEWWMGKNRKEKERKVDDRKGGREKEREKKKWLFLMEWRGRQGKETEHNTTRKFQDDMERKNKEVKEKRKVPEGELRQDRRKTGTKKEREREREREEQGEKPPLRDPISYSPPPRDLKHCITQISWVSLPSLSILGGEVWILPCPSRNSNPGMRFKIIKQKYAAWPLRQRSREADRQTDRQADGLTGR